MLESKPEEPSGQHQESDELECYPKHNCKASHAERHVRALRTVSSVLGIVLGAFVASSF